MPTFPPVTTLIAPPSAVHSNGGGVSATAPVISARYPLSRLVDGSLAQVTRFGFGTVSITITTPSCTPNIIGVLNHNIDHGRLIGVSNGAGLNRAFGARDPNCWIDLRGFPTTATSWTISVNGNSAPVSIGEIVIATGVLFTGLIEVPFREELTFPGYRDYTEYLKLYLSASGAMVRQLPLTLMPDQTTHVPALEAVFDEMGPLDDARVVLVPSTNVNDIWFVEWPPKSEFTYENVALARLPLTLLEQSGGVLNGR